MSAAGEVFSLYPPTLAVRALLHWVIEHGSALLLLDFPEAGPFIFY
jgi:hypothetical protein